MRAEKLSRNFRLSEICSEEKFAENFGEYFSPRTRKFAELFGEFLRDKCSSLMSSITYEAMMSDGISDLKNRVATENFLCYLGLGVKTSTS